MIENEGKSFDLCVEDKMSVEIAVFERKDIRIFTCVRGIDRKIEEGS